jgi:hypothetical protein
VFLAFPDLRASEADREQTAAFLNHHCAQGRLSLQELSARVDAAYRAVGLSELERLTNDLPGSPFAPAAPSRGALDRRRLSPGLGLALMALAFIAFAAAVPADVWAPLLVLAVPLVATLLFTVLPFAVPVLVVAWMLRSLTRAVGHGPGLPPPRRPSGHRRRGGPAQAGRPSA